MVSGPPDFAVVVVVVSHLLIAVIYSVVPRQTPVILEWKKKANKENN